MKDKGIRIRAEKWKHQVGSAEARGCKPPHRELVTVECFSIFLRSFICSVAPRVYEMEKDHANFEDVKQPRLGSFFTKTIGWVAHRRR